MFLRRKIVSGTHYWSLVESYRDGGKVKQRVVSSLGNTTTAIKRITSDPDLKHFLPQIEPYINKPSSMAQPAPRVLHYPGSKWSMVNWIIDHMPEHKTYLEPYFGSGAILFNKPLSKNETVNDMDGNVVNLFRVIRDRADELAQKVRWTPYSREEYYAAYEDCDDELEKARRFLVRMWQAIGGKTSDRTGWRSAIDSAGARKTKEWDSVPARILSVSDRLKNVQIEQQPAVKLIERYNRSDVLIYADPPYILETRSKRMYKHEMTEDDHYELLEALDAHSGPVLLSGYAHPIYDERLKHWKRETKAVKAESGKDRVEVLWINPAAASSFEENQLSLF